MQVDTPSNHGLRAGFFLPNYHFTKHPFLNSARHVKRLSGEVLRQLRVRPQCMFLAVVKPPCGKEMGFAGSPTPLPPSPPKSARSSKGGQMGNRRRPGKRKNTNNTLLGCRGKKNRLQRGVHNDCHLHLLPGVLCHYEGHSLLAFGRFS